MGTTSLRAGAVLFVDDQKPLVDIGKQMLERLGYKVTTRTSSTEALEAFRAQPEKFDLVITDRTMPNMTGEMLVKELMHIRPDIPVILCTGYSEIPSEEKPGALGIREVLRKPIVTREMARTIRRVLDKSNGASPPRLKFNEGRQMHQEVKTE